MFRCLRQLFCVQGAGPRTDRYTYTVSHIPRDGYSPLTLADLPWKEENRDEEEEWVIIRPLKMNEQGMYTSQDGVEVSVPRPTAWILEKYMHDVHNTDMYTVEDMEEQLGVQSDFRYGTRPDWDWLFASMSHVPAFYDKSMQRHTADIYKQAKSTTNILDDLAQRLATEKPRTSRSQPRLR